MKKYDSWCQTLDKVRDAGASRQKLHFLVSVSDHLHQELWNGSIKNPHSWAQCQNIYVNIMYFNFGTSSNTASGLTKENTLRWRKSVTIATDWPCQWWQMFPRRNVTIAVTYVCITSFLDIRNRTSSESSTSCSKKLKNYSRCKIYSRTLSYNLKGRDKVWSSASRIYEKFA